MGTAVCSNSAIATAPVIEAEERDVSFAVATITLFGTLAELLFPFIGHAIGMSDGFLGQLVQNSGGAREGLAAAGPRPLKT